MFINKLIVAYNESCHQAIERSNGYLQETHFEFNKRATMEDVYFVYEANESCSTIRMDFIKRLFTVLNPGREVPSFKISK